MALDERLKNLLTQMARSSGEAVQFEKHAMLFRTGEPTNGLFLVEHGVIRLERLTASGDTINVHRARAGTLLGEASIYSKHYHCDAVADSTGSALRLSSDAMLMRLSEDNEFASSFNAYMAQELVRLRQRVELLCIRSADIRVRTHLAALAGPDSCVPSGFVIRQLAEDIGFTPETYSRTLRQLQAEGSIDRKPDGSIQLLKRPSSSATAVDDRAG